MKTISSLMKLSLWGIVIVSVLISINCLKDKVVDSNSEPTPTPTEVSGEITTDTTWTVGGSLGYSDYYSRFWVYQRSLR